MTVVLMLAVGALALASCGDGGDETSSTTPSSTPTGKPFKIGFLEGFTGFMAVDADMTDKGIRLALDMAGNQVLGRPIEYITADHASDPVVAVDKARQLIESKKIDVMIGPIYDNANAAVTDYLGKSTGTASITIYGEPSTNLKTANNLSFIPSGFSSFAGYYTGKYAAEELGYKTANCINYEATIARELQAGFTKGFTEAGGKVLSQQYVPMDVIDFSPYLTTLKKADCTYWWIFGNGSAPFLKQYNDYGLDAPLVTSMASNLTEPQLADLGDLALDLIGAEFYSPEVDTPLNKEFVAKYREMFDGEYPTMQTFGAYIAVNLFLAGVEKTNGDTTPEKLIEAMSTATIDTPVGPYTMSPYKTAYIGTGDFYLMKTQEVGERIAWVPVYTYEQVLHEEK